MGAGHSRSMSKGEGRFLFQTMGRRSQKKGRTSTRRQNLRRISKAGIRLGISKVEFHRHHAFEGLFPKILATRMFAGEKEQIKRGILAVGNQNFSANVSKT